jgi:hypothetical protein
LSLDSLITTYKDRTSTRRQGAHKIKKTAKPNTKEMQTITCIQNLRLNLKHIAGKILYTTTITTQTRTTCLTSQDKVIAVKVIYISCEYIFYMSQLSDV